MAFSGLVLFSKEFSNGVQQPRLVGSLLTAMIEYGQQTTGMGVCYIELSNVSISIVSNDTAKIFCALLYDRSDGLIFGRLICSEILAGFSQEYSSQSSDSISSYGRNLKDFKAFHKKFNNFVKSAIKPIITQLEAQIGIKKVIYTNEIDLIETQRTLVTDQLGLLSSINSINELCYDIMLNKDDSFENMSIETVDGHLVQLWKIQINSILIIVLDKEIPSEVYTHYIEEGLEIIEQVCILHNNLRSI